MNKEAIAYFEGQKERLEDFRNIYPSPDTVGYQATTKEIGFYDLAISALKGLDLPNNATNEDALNYMLRQTFPKVIFIHFHNEANLTEGVVMSKEWLSKPYKKGE